MSTGSKIDAVGSSNVSRVKLEPGYVLTVTSDGTTGPQWINRLEDRGVHLTNHAKNLLRSSEFTATSGVTTKVIIVRAPSSERTMGAMYRLGAKMSLAQPNPEVACLIREKLTDVAMEKIGFVWVVFMHKPIDMEVLYARRFGYLSNILDSVYAEDDEHMTFDDHYGFAFVQG